MNNSDSGIKTTDARMEGVGEEETQVSSEEDDEVLQHLDSTPTESSEQTAPSGTDEERDERSWAAPIAVGVFFVVAIAVAAILLLINSTGDKKEGRRTGGRGGTEQADWKVTSYSIGGNHPSGKHARPPKQEARALEKLVRRWHDSVYLFPAELRSDTEKYFTRDAARAMRASDLGLLDSAREVETKKRSARIGIEGNGAKRAAAVVDIVATGDSAKGEFRVGSETHLWFEREGSKWKVIAFDVNQRPLPLDPKPGPAGGEGPGGKGGKDSADGKGNQGGRAPKGGADGKGPKDGRK